MITLALDNKMIITDINNKEKNDIKPINQIGDSFEKNKKNKENTFSVSAVRHNKSFWIITSYYYDKYFKIYDDYSSGKPPKLLRKHQMMKEKI